MSPQTIIITGSSGAGKGTQSRLLQGFFEQQDPERDVLYVQVGKLFRELAEEKNTTGELLDGFISEGRLVPEFLTVWAWGETLVRSYQHEQHIIFDGTPRRLMEERVLHGALEFYGRNDVLVIVLDVSEDWSRKMLAGRKREDDIHPEDVERRLRWYHTEVMPVIEAFRKHDNYHVVEVAGERSMEDVHKDIVSIVLEGNG